MAEPIDTDEERADACHCRQSITNPDPKVGTEYHFSDCRAHEIDALCDEVDSLRAENAELAAALEDIAGMWQRPDGAWVAMAECSHLTAFTCIEKHPDDPGEWCPVCVAEVAWCAWKMGVLGA